MKRLCSLLLLILFFQTISFSQTGTIKIEKPAPKPKPSKTKKAPPPKSPMTLDIYAHAGANYTFKKNKKVGYDAGLGILAGRGPHLLMAGLDYCVEEKYYRLSAYTPKSQKAETPFSASENHSEYLKLPIGINNVIAFGGIGVLRFQLGLKPEYLLKTKDEHSRLHYSDFNPYNVAFFFNAAIVSFRKFRLTAGYSIDFFSNLKDNRIYDANGSVTGKQKSRTNLLSLSLYYNI